MRTRALRTALAAAWIGVVLATSGTLAADEPTTQSVQVPIAAPTAAGPSGIAILTAGGAATTVEVLVPDAPEGATAIIHPGTCIAIGAEVAGLVGQLSANGQALGMVAATLAQLADGAHVVALHPGMDFATTLACGLIPAMAIVPDPINGNTTSCIGVPEWVAVVEADLAAIKKRDDDLALIFDPDELVTAYASNIGQAQAVVDRMKQQSVPDIAVETRDEIVSAIEFGIRRRPPCSRQGRAAIRTWSTRP